MLLQAKGKVCGFPVCRIIRVQIVAYSSDDDRACVDADANRHRAKAMVFTELFNRESRYDRDGGQDRLPGMVFVRVRSAEQRHEAVAEEIVDHTLIATHLRKPEFEKIVEEQMHGLRADVRRAPRRVDDVAKEHSHLPALAFGRRAGELKASRIRRAWQSAETVSGSEEIEARRGNQALPATLAKTIARFVKRSAQAARHGDPGPAPSAESCV